MDKQKQGKVAEPTVEQMKWYALTPEAVAQQLKVDPAKGLSAAEAQQRLQLLVDEVIKFFLRRRRGGTPAETTPALVPATTA